MKKAMKNILLIFFFLFIYNIVETIDFRVDPSTGFVLDENGRQALFHGLNVAVKTPPFVPSYDTFDPMMSLCPEDAKNLRKWGFNMVRLYIAWPGTEIGPGQYNDTYLGEVKKIVDILHENGIQVLLNCHQDAFSRYFCGEGVPDFYVEKLKKTEMKFPGPLPFDIHHDPDTGYPDLEDCLKHPFEDFYFSEAINEGFQSLYTNGSLLYNGFLDFWSHVSSYFTDVDGVMGYELLNEPWVGDIYKHPKYLLEDGVSDRELLIPFYQDIFKRINEHDQKSLIFFEPVVFEYGHVGFETCPFDAPDRCVFSYHVYCMLVEKEGEPRVKIVCHGVDDYWIDTRTSDWHRMGTAGFVTEFGCLFDDSGSVDELHWVTDQVETRHTSWSYWQFKYYNDYTTMVTPGNLEGFYTEDGSLQTEKVKSLTRTYAQRTCGEPVTNLFDPSSSKWEYVYKVGKSCGLGRTEVYLNEEWYYSSGFNVTVTPRNAVAVTQEEVNYLFLEHASWVKVGDVISVVITPLNE